MATTDEMTGIQALGEDIKPLMTLLQNLGKLGIENQNIPLPKIVVIGDQSVGKSSLVEAISEIKVPRNAGTCTRCVIQINLTSDETPHAKWKCIVTLHEKYGYATSNGGSPWVVKNPPHETHFKTVYDKDALGDVIARAQMAILDAGQMKLAYNSTDLNTACLQECSLDLGFSPNIVRLSITGPSLPNLSFYDLPGVISKTGTSSQDWQVKMIKTLVKEYVHEPHSLILLALSMETDPSNAVAQTIVSRLNAQNRTIGVLTKPDRLQSGEPLELWASILEGRKFEVGHGYSVVKQPTQASLNRGVSHAAARDDETSFFECIEPWKTTFHKYSSRFGTANLQKLLSEKLAGLVLECIPEINASIQARMNTIENELAKLPPRSQNPMGTVIEIVGGFTATVEDLMTGSPSNSEFRTEWKSLLQTLHLALENLKPVLFLEPLHKMEMRTRSTVINLMNNPLRQPQEVIQIDSDSESDGILVTPTVTPRKRRKEPKEREPKRNQQVRAPSQILTNRARVLFKQLIADDGLAASAEKFTFATIKGIIETFNATNVPQDTDPKAVDHMIGIATQHWGQAYDEFFRSLERLLEQHLFTAIQSTLFVYNGTTLFDLIKSCLDKVMQELLTEERQQGRRSLSLEQANPYAHREFIDPKYHRECEDLSKQCQEWVVGIKEDEDGSESNGSKARKTSDKVLNPMTEAILSHFMPQIQALGRVRAYYHYATYRFIEHVAQGIQVQCFRKCGEDLKGRLRIELQLDRQDIEHYANLLEHDPEIERRRAIFTKERTDLQRAQQAMEDMKRGKY